jgi:hypothetical protein
MAPQVVAHPGTRPTGRIKTVDTRQFSAPHAHPSTEDPPHDHQDECPHACNDGWVTIGQIVIDPETGEETEEFALYLCRKCADSR